MEAVQQQEQPVKTPLRLVLGRPRGQFPEIEKTNILEAIKLLKERGIPVEVHPFRQTAKKRMGTRLQNSLLINILVITDENTQAMWDDRSCIIESKYDPLDTAREGFILLIPADQNQNGTSIHHADLVTEKTKKDMEVLIKTAFGGKSPANWTFPKSMHTSSEPTPYIQI